MNRHSVGLFSSNFLDRNSSPARAKETTFRLGDGEWGLTDGKHGSHSSFHPTSSLHTARSVRVHKIERAVLF